MKKIHLDMDGTIANLYGQENWLQKLLDEDSKVFEDCEPMITEEKLFELFDPNFYEIEILSMTPKEATEKYCQDVVRQKNKWLDKFFPNLTKRIFIPYGYDKNYGADILIDDSEKIRKNFKNLALNPIDLW